MPWALHAYRHWDTHSRTRASQEPIQHYPNKSHGDGKGSPETLKRLAISVFDVEVFSLPQVT